MLTMSEKDKNEMLDTVNSNEAYEAKMWGTLMASDAELLKNSLKYSLLIGGALGGGLAGASGAFSNQYSYIGMTATGIYFVIIETFNIKKINNIFKIPYEVIEAVKIKGGIIPGRKVLYIKTSYGNLKLALMNNAIGSDIQGQKEAVTYFCDFLKTRFP